MLSKKRLYFLVLLIFFLTATFTHLILLRIEQKSELHNKLNSIDQNWEAERLKARVELLRKFAKNESWPIMLILIPRLLRPNGKVPDFNLEINPNCEHKCFYTIDGFLLPIADGVFVQPNAIDWKGPKRYSPKQKFFAYLREAPGHYNSLRFKWSPSYQFNYTVGFVPGCDIEAGYDKIPPKGVAYFGRTQQPNLTIDEEWEHVKETIRQKTGAGFAVISNCNTRSKREFYLNEFQRRYPHLLKLYGKCYNNNGVKCPNEKCIIPNIRSHRFYFAFENSICKNYVTEKFFRIKQLIVPVVLRRSDYRHLLPDDAFISVDDFDSNSAERLSVEELLEHPYVSLKSNSENMAEMTVSEEQIVNLLKEMKDSTPRTIAKNLKSVLKQR